jgi:hypothetical protein
MPSQLLQDGAINVVDVAANYRKVITGSQLGTPQLQALLIKTYNEDWGNIVTEPETQNDNIRVSAPGSTFSRIIRAVQDYAEIYYIGNPQKNVGGENNVTECVVWVNVNTNTSGGELRSNGRWTELENHIQVNVPTNDPVYVWFAVPDGWVWRADGIVPTSGEGPGWFPYQYQI